MISNITKDCSPCEHEGGFECLLANISCSFVNVSLEELDELMEKSLKDIVNYMNIDYSDIWQWDNSIKKFILTHYWIREGFGELSLNEQDEKNFPYLAQRITEGKNVIINSLSELPPEAATDKASLQKLEYKSMVSFPLIIKRELYGVISFVTIQTEKHWSDNFVRQLQLIGEVFSNAFMQRDKEVALKQALEENILLRQSLEAEKVILQEEVFKIHAVETIIGESLALSHIMNKINQVATTDSTVLLLGETGTGKDLVANCLHMRSRRAHQPFIRVNCAALPETLIESELFGHEKGAFTGAQKLKLGRFELANGGTLVLDEIGELPLALQAKLLRAIQNGDFERLGSQKTIHSDVRLIASTNRNLQEMIAQGKFRPDLYYRLHVFPITVPPLKERKEDIPMLVEYFINKLQGSLNKQITKIPDETLRKLMNYDWPGNIRELQNVVERSLILSPGSTFIVEELESHLLKLPQFDTNPCEVDTTLVQTLDEINQEHIRKVCERCGWKIHGKGNVADQLGVNPNTLRSKMKKLGITRPVSIN